MSNIGTKIIEQGSTAGGIAKVQYLDESGNVLYEVNDSDKIFKMVNGKISGLAGTGNRMVTADSSGNLSASGEITGLIQAEGNILTNAIGLAGTVSSAYIRSLNAYSTPTNPDYSFWYNDNTGIYHPSADTLGISSGGVSRAIFSPSGIKLPLLAGTGNRAVYSDALGVLTNTSSDVRVKKNIENITNEMNVLDVLKSIRGVTYNWDNTIEGYEGAGEQQEIGVIAQEIEQHIPQIVGENSTGYKSVDYAKLTAYLIEVDKALLERIEELEKKVL